MPLSLYIHIPFCEVKCGYCDFYSVPRGFEDFNLQKEYVDQLIREIDLRASEFSDRPILSIFFGGGTPSLLDLKLFERIVMALQRHFRWDPETEFTIEANPKTVSPEKLKGFRSLGINRISIGVQSFQDRFLKKLGRIHTGAEAKKTVNDARRAGFDNLSIDLIFALPGQTFGDWKDDLAEGLLLETPHLSAYHLTIEPGTPFESLYRKKALRLPPEEIGVAMLTWTREKLSASGGRLEPYEISNFSLPGFESVHNRNYWHYGEYLGFGTAAASFVKRSGPSDSTYGTRRTNVRDLKKYLAGEWEGFSEEIGRETSLGEFCMLALRTREGIREENFAREFARSFRKVYSRELANLEEKGWIGETEGSWRLTSDGLLFADEVAQAFLP